MDPVFQLTRLEGGLAFEGLSILYRGFFSANAKNPYIKCVRMPSAVKIQSWYPIRSCIMYLFVVFMHHCHPTQSSCTSIILDVRNLVCKATAWDCLIGCLTICLGTSSRLACRFEVWDYVCVPRHKGFTRYFLCPVKYFFWQCRHVAMLRCLRIFPANVGNHFWMPTGSEMPVSEKQIYIYIRYIYINKYIFCACMQRCDDKIGNVNRHSTNAFWTHMYTAYNT